MEAYFMVAQRTHMTRGSTLLLVCSFLFLIFLGSVGTSHAGWTLINVDNTSKADWGDFHIRISAIPGMEGSLYDVSNVGFDTDKFDPLSSQDIDSFAVSADKKELDFFFFKDPVDSGDNGWWLANISNPDGALYQTSFYPTVVPEPVSSTLFIVGAATLGYRRFRKKRNTV
jgi:hypothetical protein